MSRATEERVERLPQWAQRHIANLTRQRDDALAALEEGPESDTFARDGGWPGVQRPLGQGTSITFGGKSASESIISARWVADSDRPHLQVHGHPGLLVLPRAANSLVLIPEWVRGI